MSLQQLQAAVVSLPLERYRERDGDGNGGWDGGGPRLDCSLRG